MKIRNAILNTVIFTIAILPFPVIYLLSDFLSFFIRVVIRYRREVIITNLTRSFPEKSETEIKAIARKFYRNLADLIMENIKSSRMTRKQVEDRVEFLDQEVFAELYNEKRSVFAALGHCGNWEWVGNKIATFLQHDGGAIYKPVHDKFFDDYMIGLRQKYKGTLMIDYKKVFRTLVSLKDKLIAVFVLADQSPPKTEMNYFVQFMGQKTAFFEGMEKVARAMNYTVIYLDIQRVKRGYYQVEVKTISKESRDTAPDYITQSYVNMLEESIRNQPDNWLWSHRRWKKREEKPN